MKKENRENSLPLLLRGSWRQHSRPRAPQHIISTEYSSTGIYLVHFAGGLGAFQRRADKSLGQARKMIKQMVNTSIDILHTPNFSAECGK